MKIRYDIDGAGGIPWMAFAKRKAEQMAKQADMWRLPVHSRFFQIDASTSVYIVIEADRSAFVRIRTGVPGGYLMRLVMRRSGDGIAWTTPMLMFTYGSRKFVPLQLPFVEPTEINSVDNLFHNGVMPAPGAASAIWHGANETTVPLHYPGDVRTKFLYRQEVRDAEPDPLSSVSRTESYVVTENGIRKTPVGLAINVVNRSGTLGISSFVNEVPIFDLRDNGTPRLEMVQQRPTTRVVTTDETITYAPFDPTLVDRAVTVTTQNYPAVPVLVDDELAFAATLVSSTTTDRVRVGIDTYSITGNYSFNVTSHWGEVLAENARSYVINTDFDFVGWPFPFVALFTMLAADGATGFYAWEVGTATGFTASNNLMTEVRTYVRHAGVTTLIHEGTRSLTPGLLPGPAINFTNLSLAGRDWWAASAKSGKTDAVYVLNTSTGPVFGGRGFKSAALAELRKVVDSAAQAAIDVENLAGYTVTPYLSAITRDDFFSGTTRGIAPT